MKLHYKKYWRTYLRIREKCNEVMEIKSEQDKMVWGLYARIDALATECMLILNTGSGASCPMLIRGMLESFIDMKCLIEDPEYVRDIQARHVSKEIKHLSRYKEDNVFYTYRSREEVEEKLKNLKAELNGVTPLSIHDRFAKVDELHVYHTVYHTLSEGSHSSLSNISKAYDGVNYTLVKAIHIKESNFYYLTTIGFACRTLAMLLMFKGKGEEHVAALRENAKRVTEKGNAVAHAISDL